MNYNELNLWGYKKMKTLSYFAVGLLLLSSFAALSIGEEAAVGKKTIDIQFLEPIVLRSEGYVELDVEGANAQSYHAGEPILPIYTKTFSFPFGTKIIDIKCETGDINNMVLSDKIVPAPQRVIRGMGKSAPEYKMNEAIYNCDEVFPDGWFKYYTGGGLDADNEHKTFLTVRVYPVRYNPMTDTIHYVENIDLKIVYEEPDTDPFPENSEYDMVIIAPSEFSGELQKLVDHKNGHNVATMLKTTEEIYSEFSGADKPEQIKYFIKDSFDNWGINYVMLVGGMKSLLWGDSRDDKNQGTKDWHVPVRYTNLQEVGGTHDPGFISDLYYADIYDSEGNFSSWDLDKNGESDGIFANWKFGAGKDIIDLYPDVYVGRLACRNKLEVELMVDKIINYETSTSGSSWFNKMVAIGGDSHDDFGTDYIEGEVVCDYILDNYMPDFDPVKLYASYKDTDPQHTPSTDNIKREISAGCGFLLFDGHGQPGSWNTHWPGIFNWDDTPGGISCYDFPKLSNGDKLPICVVGGCHNSQFNITILGTLLKKPYMWTHGLVFPECFGWWLTRKNGGGSIATMGNTGLGYGSTGEHGDLDGDGVNLPDTLEAVGGYQELCFFKTYAEGKNILGEVWGGAQKKYLDAFPGMDDQIDCKTVEQWPIFGDPSLKIGGYS